MLSCIRSRDGRHRNSKESEPLLMVTEGSHAAAGAALTAQYMIKERADGMVSSNGSAMHASNAVHNLSSLTVSPSHRVSVHVCAPATCNACKRGSLLMKAAKAAGVAGLKKLVVLNVRLSWGLIFAVVMC